MTKLSYLLSKPEFSVKEVRELIGSPLRGELTRSSGTAPSQPTIEHNLDNIQHVLSQFVRLSRPTSLVPQVVVTPDSIDATAHDAAAPWTWTAAEAATTEAVLFPFLVHLAAARDDIESLNFSLGMETTTDDPAPAALNTESLKYRNIAGSIVNCLEQGSGRSPLHVAALNGNTRAVDLLLRSGALVHLRDALGHTALYYVRILSSVVVCLIAPQAARQGHGDVVNVLVQAGATLGGSDRRFVDISVSDVLQIGNETALRIWEKCGVKILPNRDTQS